MSASTRSLGDDIKAGRKELSAVTETEEEEAEILGFLTYSTTGDVLVPRDWLQEELDAEGLPDWLMPNEVWPSSAYKRAMSRLIDNGWEESWLNGLRVEYELREGDGNVRHLTAHIFYPEEKIGEEGGRWKQEDIGFFNYNADSQNLTWTALVNENDEPVLYEEWKRFVGRAQGLFEKMKKHHTGQDMRTVLYDIRKDHTNAIPMRDGGAVYFFPAHLDSEIEALSDIWARMNLHKERGKRCEVAPFPVVDDEKRREIIQTRAEELIQEQVDEAIEAGIETLQEAEEETAADIARGVVDELAETTSLAEEHSQLLEARLSVKRHIQDWLDALEDEKRELVEEVLDRSKLPEFENEEVETDGGPDETGFIWGNDNA